MDDYILPSNCLSLRNQFKNHRFYLECNLGQEGLWIASVSHAICSWAEPTSRKAKHLPAGNLRGRRRETWVLKENFSQGGFDHGWAPKSHRREQRSIYLFL